MFVFLTFLVCVIYVITFVQRGGISIDFNEMIIKLRSDLNEIKEEIGELGFDDADNGKNQFKLMMIFSLMFHLAFMLYFYLAYKNGILVLKFLFIMIASILFDIVAEYIFYKIISKNSKFTSKQNSVLSKISTINNIFQLTTFLYIIERSII